MSDESLIRALRALDRPVGVDPAFEDALFGILEREYAGRRQFQPRLTLLLVAALLVALVVGGALAVGSGLLRLPSPDPHSSIDFRLDLNATEMASWSLEAATRSGTMYQGSSAEFFAELVVERPEAWADHVVSNASDMINWLTSTARLDVARVEPVLLGGRSATAIEARPVAPPDARPGSWESHYWYPTGSLMLDVGWRYRFIVPDLGDAGWLVVTCAGDAPGWPEASRACAELLATWEWVEP